MAPQIELGEDSLESRVHRAVESILENESLTADLDDQAARLLLDWGVDWAKTIALGTAGLDDLMAGDAMTRGLRAVRRLMRAINKWVGTEQGDDIERSAALISRILEQAAILHGEDVGPVDAGQLAVFHGLRQECAANQSEMVAAVRREVEGRFSEGGMG